MSPAAAAKEIAHGPACGEAVTAIICETVRQACAEQFGDDLRALVLTGSVARGEAGIVCAGNVHEVPGDAEFIAVLHDGAKLREIHDVSEEVAARGVRCDVGIAVVHEKYLRELPAHIFSYELRQCGRVVSGEQEILSAIPDYRPGELSREDAWRLLVNRIVEQLGDDAADVATPAAQYRAVKLVLDTATSLLVFVGAYEPTYAARAVRVRALSREDAPFEIAPFAELVTRCTEWKLKPAGALPDDLQKRARDYAQRLWQWELRQMTGADGDHGFARLCREQSTAERILGWMYALRCEGWWRAWRELPRWLRLAERYTPRYAIYRAAFRLSNHSSDLSAEVAAEIRALLLVNRTDATCRRELAADIVWNYRRFVMGTRA